MIITKESKAKIIIPANATEREKFAADELKKYIKKICGANLEITTKPDGEAIIIGDPSRNEYAKKYISEAEFDKLVPGPEGIFIKDFGDCVILAGSSKNENERERGTIYSVYELLERFLDCSLAAYTKEGVPGGELVPEKESIDLTGVYYIKAKADLPYRGVCAQYSAHGVAADYDLDHTFLDWLCKNRYNYFYTWNAVYEHFKENGMLDECAKRGFIFRVGHHDTIDTLMPPHGNKYFPEEYYVTHPEYYKMLEDGSRFEMVDNWGQMVLCSRNDEMIEQLANNMIEWLNQNPQVKVYAFSNKDGTAPQCCCPKCKPYTKTENYYYMMTEVAKRVAKVHPDVRIGTSAYTDMWTPPASVKKLEDNMMVSLAVWHATGLRKCGKPDGSCLNGTFFEDAALEWRDVGAAVIYYEYYMGVYPGRQRYVPMADEMQALYKNMVKNKIFGVQSQFEVYNHWNNLFNYYTCGRTSYNTELSMEDNLKLFTRIFGKGAEFVADNIRYAEEVLDGQCEIMTAGIYLQNHIDKERIYAGYDKALAAAETPAARNNIRLMRMAFRYSDLESREDYTNDEKGYKALKHYDIPERGELLYMKRNFDSYDSHGGYGISIPVEGEDNGFTPTDTWYDIE